MSQAATTHSIYKILPSAESDPRHAFPIPIPANYDFAVSDLDAQDGYLHFSTSSQIGATLSRFFATAKSVVLLKVDLKQLTNENGSNKIVKWEAAGSGGASLFRCSIAWMEG